METAQKKPNPALSALVAALITAALIFCSGGFPLLLALVPMPAIYMTVTRGWLGGAAFFIYTVALIWLLLPALLLWMLLLMLPCVFITAFAIKKRYGGYEALVLSCGSCLVGILLIVAAVYIMTGTDVISALMAAAPDALRADQSLATFAYCMLIAPDLASTDVNTILALLTRSAADITKYVTAAESLESLRTMLATYLPIIAMRWAVYGGFLCYIIPRATAKKHGTEVSALPKFSMFMLPKNVSLITAILFLLGAIPTLFNITALILPGAVLFNTMFAIFSIQGVSLVWNLFSRIIRSRGGAIALTIVLCVIFSALIGYIGFIDQMFSFRRRNIGGNA